MKKIKISQKPTDLMDESVASYVTSIMKNDLISAEEEKALAHRIHLGDEKALNKLVCSNLRFVVSVARQYLGRGLELADLISEGNIGLCKAAEKFDESRDVKFTTFAVNYIQQAILDALSKDSRFIRLPHGQVTVLSRIRDIQNRYMQQFDRPADIEEIAEELETTPSTVKAILLADSKGISLNAPIHDDEDSTLQDYFQAESDYYSDAAIDRESDMKELDLMLHSVLKERDIYVIRHSFGLGCEELHQNEIALNLGLSRERVRQIRDNAIQKLRDPRIYQRLRMCC